MFGISPLVLNHLRETVKPGTRVKLITIMENDPRPVPVGTCGTVSHIDDTGTVFVSWDTGSSLGLVYGEDKYEIISEE